MVVAVLAIGSPPARTQCETFANAPTNCGVSYQSGDPRCVCTRYSNPSSQKYFRVDATTADEITGITGGQFQRAVMQAASTWNDNGNTR